MTDIQPDNAAFYWATVFFRKLQNIGIQHVIISPGSRSTPLTLAAATNCHFHKHVILDERTASFTALGIGKATGTPAVLICTSGTALANYHPAVIEARQSGIPMIVTTADRPPHLRATGANQAIDQLKIFGDYPVFFHEVGEPHLEVQDLNRLELLAEQAVATSRELRGPVHLNFPFRKPLEPEKEFLQRIATENKQHNPACKNHLRESYHLSKDVRKIISHSEKPLIIVGPTAPVDELKSIGQLADDMQIPVLAESSVNSKYIVKGFAGFLRSNTCIEDLEPDLILRFGFQPTVKALEIALTQWKPNHHLHFATTHDWHDATFSGARHISWMRRQLKYKPITTSIGDNWIPKWKEAEQKFEEYYEGGIARNKKITDGEVYHQLTPQIPDNNFIAISNSFPARDIQLFGQQSTAIPLYLNRGVSGIDGITSTAIGLNLGLSHSGVLFTGDLAFLHDSNALLNKKLLEHSLVVIIINNSGGSIFKMLPVEQHQQYFNSYFETPQSVDFEMLVNSHGIPYNRIDTLQALQCFDLQKWIKSHQGLSVIECQTDAETSMNLRKYLWDFKP